MRGCGGGVCAPARCRGDGSDSAMAASMFYGRQLAAAALRSHRPQPTLRAAAQVSPPSPRQPRGVGGGAVRGAGTSRVPCGAHRRGCEPGVRAGARAAPLRPESSGGPVRRPGCSPRLRDRGGARREQPGAVLAEGRRFRAPFG